MTGGRIRPGSVRPKVHDGLIWHVHALPKNRRFAKKSGPKRRANVAPALTTAKGYFAMASRADITPELCRQLLRYEPETGKLFWLPRPRSMFASDRACSVWNARYAGKAAFTAVSRIYHVGTILNVMVKAHRVAWAIHFGEWPEVIDHIDGDGLNNRIDNLRSIKQADNLKNLAIRSDNTTSAVGVYRAGSRWTAQVNADGKSKHVGTFDTLAEAESAALEARIRLGYHPNHGRSAA